MPKENDNADFMENNKYTKEDLANQVKMLANELGRTPTADEFNQDPRVVSMTTVSQSFNSWFELLETAGLKAHRGRRKKYTEEDLIYQVTLLASELGKTPTSNNFEQDSRTPSATTASNYFGSWNNFLEAAGLRINRKRNYTKEDLVTQVMMLANEFNRTPTLNEFCKDSRVASGSTVVRLFGSWGKFLGVAGLKINQRMRYYTDEDLISQVKMLAKELKRTPTSNEFDNDPRTASEGTIIRFFGTWNKFLEIAGLKINRRRIRQTDEDLIAQVKMLADELGRTPMANEFHRDSRTASVTTIGLHFGTWNDFLKVVGLKVNRGKGSYVEEILITQVKMLAKEFGRTPTVDEFNRDPRTMSATAVNHSFGSWNKLLEAAGLKVNQKTDYTKEDLITQVKMLAKNLGKNPTANIFARDRQTASLTIVRKFFGSWSNFLVAAGLK